MSGREGWYTRAGHCSTFTGVVRGWRIKQDTGLNVGFNAPRLIKSANLMMRLHRISGATVCRRLERGLGGLLLGFVVGWGWNWGYMVLCYRVRFCDNNFWEIRLIIRFLLQCEIYLGEVVWVSYCYNIFNCWKCSKIFFIYTYSKSVYRKSSVKFTIPPIESSTPSVNERNKCAHI